MPWSQRGKESERPKNEAEIGQPLRLEQGQQEDFLSPEEDGVRDLHLLRLPPTSPGGQRLFPPLSQRPLGLASLVHAIPSASVPVAPPRTERSPLSSARGDP